ncbi:MAG: hypothetical protein WD851_01335 [Pirellulales bacterium]
MSAAVSRRPRVGGFCFIGALLLVIAPATRIRSADEVNESRPAQDVADISATSTWGESVDQVANDILRLRQSVGSAWRSDAIPGSTQSAEEATEREVRTALVAQARSTVEESPSSGSPSDFGTQVALRDAAHQLDITAHALECQGLYPQADEVRAVAQRLRQQARPEPVPLLRYNGKQLTPVPGRPAD